MTDTTEENFVNLSSVKKSQKSIPSEKELLELSETFKALSDPTRLKIICALLKSELCVGDIALMLQVSDSLVSHQLRILRNLKLVIFRKVGKASYYSLDDEHINRLIKEGLLHVRDLD
ncbi:MAG: metalloregulator ArsR/SmtB family transcription factor [SAR324 cluster bacterium]|nr:metalloregulator ArsR/SmtB family transcription factor [SAR324 cluster bacterium]